MNDAPVASAQTVNTDKNASKEITHTATDADGDTLSYILVTIPINGTLSESGSVILANSLPRFLSTNKLTYSPNTNYKGSDSYTFKVYDGNLFSEAATVSITITAIVAVSTFNNAGGDNLWSNPANWSAGIPNVDNTKLTVDSDLIIDSSVTVAQIKMSGATSDASVTITATNSSVLTVTGAGVTQLFKTINLLLVLFSIFQLFLIHLKMQWKL